MRKRISALLLVLLLTLGCGAARASGRLSDAISIEICLDGEWQPLEQHLLYAHEGGVLADGALVFVPLHVYLKSHPIPTAALTEEPRFRILQDASVTRCTVTLQLYRAGEQQLEKMDMPDHSLTELPEGAYLLAIRWDAEGRSGTACCQGMLWLLSGSAQLPAFAQSPDASASAPEPTPVAP